MMPVGYSHLGIEKAARHAWDHQGTDQPDAVAELLLAAHRDIGEYDILGVSLQSLAPVAGQRDTVPMVLTVMLVGSPYLLGLSSLGHHRRRG